MHRLFLAMLSALIVALPAEGSEAPKSVKVPFVKGAPARVTVENGGIRVVGYRFSRPTRGSASLFKMGNGPAVVLNVRNDGAVARDFAVAVALFDRSGNLVAAATENPRGKLGPGEETEIEVTFRDVNRYAAYATSIQMSLEIRL